MVAGRPRTSTPPPEEMLLLGEEMLTWVKSHPEALHLSCWYSIEKFITDEVWRNMIRAKEFSPYYDRALKLIGQKYLDKTSNVREGISQRWQRVYFKDLKEQEDADLDDAANRERKTNETQAGDLNSAMSFVKYMQDQASKLESKSDSSNSNNDKKS